MSDQRAGSFGTYFLSLADEVEALRRSISEAKEKLSGIASIGFVIDRERLYQGQLTGDPRLDAAICLSLGHYRGESLPRGTKTIYKKNL